MCYVRRIILFYIQNQWLKNNKLLEETRFFSPCFSGRFSHRVIAGSSSQPNIDRSLKVSRGFPLLA